MGLSKYTFLFALMGCLLVLSMWLTGVAILVLTVPVYFPVALSLGVDPVHLGILTALCIEIGSVIPPVGLNLFAVSGVTGLPVTQVIRGSFPFCVSDTVVLVIVLLFPLLALWLPAQLITSHFYARRCASGVSRRAAGGRRTVPRRRRWKHSARR